MMIQSAHEFIRPSDFEELVGLDDVITTIKYHIEGAKLLNQPPSSFLLQGGPGTGKTTIGKLIAKYNGGNFLNYAGYNFKSNRELECVLAQCKDGDTLFIEESHSMPSKAQIPLLILLEEFKLDTESGQIDAPKVCLVFSTTNSSRLIKPLRERCVVLSTNYLSVDQIKQVLKNAANKFNMELERDAKALDIIATSSRSTPRTAIQRLDIIRKYLAVEKTKYSEETVKKCFEINKIDPNGLDKFDKLYLNILYEKMKFGDNRAVSHKIMAQSLGIDADQLDMIESYLQFINAIRIIQSGRMITLYGCDLIDQQPLRISNFERQQIINIDLVKLKQLLEDKELCQGGMKAIAPLIGLKYPQQNNILRAALSKCGFKAVQHAGIVPI